MPEQLTQITVNVDDIENALRAWLRHFEYDLHKNLECGEEDGLDRYPEEAAAFFACLAPAETGEQRADREATERDHTAGDHTYCGVNCEVEFPSESLRNGILARAIPGSAAMLDELLRRAAVPPAPAADRADLRDRIAQVLADSDAYALISRRDDRERFADAVLAVLPTVPADRAAALREAADAVAEYTGSPLDASALMLRRRADGTARPGDPAVRTDDAEGSAS
ncbi:hypothetical protein [Streptomyces sp. NPDC048442]|uniref:hypothetical protein n=1 Tax=Streptomyces sp. NPDC048442 TaxID=3154823 RepID=UPI00341C620C